jgi:PAS domain S-box-containing protein
LIYRSSAASQASVIDTIPQAISILVVEDDPEDFGLIDAYLRQTEFWRSIDKPRLVWTKTLAEGIEAARHQQPDVVLLDLSLPDSSGTKTVVAMNAVLRGEPIVVLTGRDDNKLAIAALEAGAQDYLVKGQFDHTALARAVRFALVRARLESRLRLFEAALDSAANGIVITDTDANIQWANPAFTQITGFSVAEVLGRNPSDQLKSGKQDQAFYRHMWKTILSGQEWRGDLVNRRKDGTLYDEALAIAPVIGRDGAIQNFIAIKQDISYRKRAEQQLLELAESQEERVSERTRQLRTLSAQLTMTEERERQLLAQELHDNLGQLLAVIKIKLTSLAAGRLQPAVNQIVELVDQADRSARMITRELSPPILRTLGLASALEWLAEEMSRLYDLTVHLGNERCTRPLIEGVQAVLYRSARELLINVAKHARVSEANLDFICDNNQLIMVVSDDGCGFDAVGFRQASPGQRSFGLSSIHERITNIGGEMDIDSHPGQGTTITLTLPCAIAVKETLPS